MCAPARVHPALEQSPATRSARRKFTVPDRQLDLVSHAVFAVDDSKYNGGNNW